SLVRARKHGRDRKRREQGDEGVGLSQPALAQWPDTIVVLPMAAAPRLRVPHEIERWHSGPLYLPGIQSRRLLRSSDFQIFGHFLRASSAARCSMAMSSPATKARRPPIPVPPTPPRAV